MDYSVQLHLERKPLKIHESFGLTDERNEELIKVATDAMDRIKEEATYGASAVETALMAYGETTKEARSANELAFLSIKIGMAIARGAEVFTKHPLNLGSLAGGYSFLSALLQAIKDREKTTPTPESPEQKS